MANGKWIPDLSATTPVEDAARRVLGVRLAVVRDFLGLAIREPEKDPEYVHQLRVGTRRSRAAVDIFSCCLPQSVFKSAKKTLRRLRRAAGAARDWDVFLATIGAEARKDAAEKNHAGLDALLGYALSQRLAAQQEMEQSVPDPFTFDRCYTDILHAVRLPDSGPATLLELARPALLAMIEQIDVAAARDLENYENLHQVRILGKRLRYAMEVFAPCFPEAFREVHYAVVEQMQDVLGLVNDSHVACERLSYLAEKMKALVPREWQRYERDIKQLLVFHDERLPRERKHFEELWTHWQSEPDGKAGLLNFIS